MWALDQLVRMQRRPQTTAKVAVAAVVVVAGGGILVRVPLEDRVEMEHLAIPEF